MSRMIQILAVMLGAVWFLPVSCTTGMIVVYPLVSKSHERHMDKGDEPSSLFTVVWQPGAGSEPFGYAKLANLTPAEKAVPVRSFIMTQLSGRIEGGRSEMASYKVLSSTATEQLIEVTWANATYGSVSRYRATRTEVKPVFSKVEAPDIMIKALLLAMVFAAALFAVGRWLRRRVASVKAAGVAASEATPRN